MNKNRISTLSVAFGLITFLCHSHAQQGLSTPPPQAARPVTAGVQFDLETTAKPARELLAKYLDALNKIKAALSLRTASATLPAERQILASSVSTLDREIASPFSQNLTKVLPVTFADSRQYSSAQIQKLYSDQLNPIRQRLKQEGARAVANSQLDLANAITEELQKLNGTAPIADAAAPSSTNTPTQGPTTSTTTLPEYSVSANGRSYIIVDAIKSYDEAKAMAKARGQRLASIKGMKPEEVSALLKACFDEVTAKSRATQNKWIRLGDRCERGRYLSPDGAALPANSRVTVEKLITEAWKDPKANPDDDNLLLSLDHIGRSLNGALDRKPSKPMPHCPYFLIEK